VKQNKTMNENIFLDTLKGKPISRPPVWFMRQAGRILPSYLAIKENYTFWQMMQNPEIAAQVTLLPVDDLGVDAAILFSDILIVPYAMGMGLDFTDNGPVFAQPLAQKANPVSALNPDASKFEYVYKVIDQIIKTRKDNTPLIGFCGSPLTVLCYMLQGLGKNPEFPEATKFFYQNKKETEQLVDAITELSIEYALGQIEHGVEAFQLFETHAGLIPWEMYREVFLPSVQIIATAVRAKGIPFIYFPKGLGTGLIDINFDHCDFVSIDWQTPLNVARMLVDDSVGLQGNLDPRLLYASQDEIKRVLESYLHFGRSNSNWIFNLGHGFMPGLPVENAKFIVDWVKQADWR